MIELHIMMIEVIRHILVDDLRIGRYDRTVEMVRRSSVFYRLVVDRRIEYPLYAVLDQPLDMSVYNLCRVARGIRRYGVHSALVDVLVCSRAQNDSESELCKERMPERIVLVHVEHSRDTYDAPLCLVLIKDRPVEEQIVLDLVQIRKLRLSGRGSCSLFTAVSCYVSAAVSKSGYGQKTVVSASSASRVRCFDAETVDLVERKHIGTLALNIAVAGDNG